MPDIIDPAQLHQERSIADRYTLVARLGEGSFGEVWRGRDELTGQPVALKFLRAPQLDPTQLWRETTVLRRLRAPQLVRFLDEGLHQGVPYVVLSLVEDAGPWPGNDLDWRQAEGTAQLELLEPRVVGLLEALDMVHRQGVLHGDLKPPNALVRPDGQVILLDFGLSALQGLRGSGSPSGSPQYLAPERLRGRPASRRADLYGLGVMLFHALYGRFPHPANTLSELMRTRLAAEVEMPPLALQRQHPLDQLTAQLLRRDAEERPSVRAALRLLLDAGPAAAPLLASGQPPGPLRHPPQAFEELHRQLLTQRWLGIWAAPGEDLAGFTEQAAQWLQQREGTRVLQLSPSSLPLNSLLEGLALPPDTLEHTLGLEQARQALRAHLERGPTVVVLQGQPDPATLELLQAPAPDLLVLEVLDRPHPRAFVPPPPQRRALEALWRGPEAGYHLRSRATALLWRASGGRRSRMLQVLRSWEQQDLVEWDPEEEAYRLTPETVEGLERLGGLVAGADPDEVPPGDELSRGLLQGLSCCGGRAPWSALAELLEEPVWRLQALARQLEDLNLVRCEDDELWAAGWQRRPDQIEAKDRQRALQALPPLHPSRHTLALLSEDPDEILEELGQAAVRLDREGQVDRAAALLRQAAQRLRQLRAPEAQLALLEQWAGVDLASPSARKVDELMLAAAPLREHSPRAAQLYELLEAVRATFDSGGEHLLELFDEVGVMEDQTLEVRRRMMRLGVCQGVSNERLEQELREAEAHFGPDPSDELRGVLYAWRSTLAYHREDFATANELEQQVMQLRERRSARIASLLSLAEGLLDVFQYEEAAALIATGLEMAQACGHHLYEIDLRVAEVMASYRRAEQRLEVDEDLYLAVQTLGDMNTSALLDALNACICWRSGEFARAREWARRSLPSWLSMRFMGPAICVASLDLYLTHLLGQEVDQQEHQLWLERALAYDRPRMVVQALGLLGAVRPPGPEAMEVLEARLEETPREFWDHRLEILSLNEAMALAAGEEIAVGRGGGEDGS